MARGMTRFVAIGNLGRDPEMRYSQNGTPVTTFSLAVGRYDSQTKGEVTDWYRISMFGKQAELAAEWLHKGDRCQVDGKLQLRTFTGQDGQERQRVEVVADGFMNLSPREGAGDAPGTRTPARVGAVAQAGPRDVAFDDLDDVPF